jgi:trk system potassium uptake protein TrkH
LLAGGAVPMAVLRWVHGPIAPARLSWPLMAAVASMVCALAAGATIVRKPAIGRVFATLALLGVFALAAPYLLTAPSLSLIVLLATTGALAGLWNRGQPLFRFHARHARQLDSQTRGAALTALLFWLIVAMAGGEHAPLELLAVALALLAAAAMGVEWTVRARAEHPIRARLIALALLASCLLAVSRGGNWWLIVSSGAVLAATIAVVVPRPRRVEMETTSWWEPLLGHPERLLVGTFATLAAAGASLLALPQSAAGGESIGFLDAAFTAVSAVCVTGLIVLDTPVDFSHFGQVVILVLIQLGGLGIMTFSTAAMRVLGRRMSLRHEGAVASLISPQDRGRLFGAAQRIIVLTFATEATGALLLFLAFLGHGDSIAEAVWRALFTSISAFCNAGFALQSDSLIPYQGDPFILHVISVLIIIGGLSPAAVVALPLLARRSIQPVSAQIKLSLAVSAILLVLGFAFILAAEWDHALADLDYVDRLHNAWFQSVTLRTAGFNSIDIAAVRSATLVLMLVWMFIGGSPGGTAGGVKTTTIAMLVLAVVNAVRGHWNITVFRRRITERTLFKAAVIATLGAAAVVVGILAVELTQAMPARAAIFEVVSALGTVGLSIGGTGQLDSVGKIIIIICMFAGRVGPLSLLMFLSQRNAPRVLARPEEEIDVG